MIAIGLLFFALVIPAASPGGTAVALDFSGTWILDSALSRGTKLPGGMEMRVQQRPDAITIEHTSRSQFGVVVDTVRAPLDGSVDHDSVTVGGTKLARITSGMWEQDKLRISRSSSPASAGYSQTELWALDRSTGKLLIESSTTVSERTISVSLFLHRTS